MIHPKRDLIISVVLFLAGLAAFLLGLPDMLAGREGPILAASMVGAFIAFFAFLALLNFLWALILRKRMQEGRGLIARWTVPAPAMDAFFAWETQQAPNHWRAAGGRAVDVAFAPEYALVDGQIYTMPTSGPQSVRAVHWIEGDPPVLLFETAHFVTRGATVQTYGMEQGQLRVPVGDRRAGQQVLAAFQDMLAGRVIVHPRRWDIRIRIGQVTMAVAATTGLWGWWMADRTGWNGNEPWAIAAMIAMIVGIICTIAGAVLVTMASAFRRRQRGQADR